MSDNHDPNAPRPGRDYYAEQGRVVFTAAFLLRRGWCCGNGCRHCPYQGEAKRGTPRQERRGA